MNLGRSITGSKYHKRRKKRHHERSHRPNTAVVGETKTKSLRTRGGSKKTTILKTNQVNIITDGKAKKAEIKTVLETPQNTFFARQNRILKGAIIETTLGKARITNRPGQEGHINAVLIKE